ncbi:hypothetical protein FHS56_000943 [Thermonema lapsum]|uniref:Uncharacterized protein n=1 Tax=Thermonema lapsum TaxID=28195 RepID=A0A846MQ99_9BACT|nr:hypothetical protein [Thermonema lapsum]
MGCSTHLSSHSLCEAYGVVVSPDLFAGISAEEGLDEIGEVRTMQRRIFQDVETARQWLTEE